jgi:hypothetical protein
MDPVSSLLGANHRLPGHAVLGGRFVGRAAILCDAEIGGTQGLAIAAAHISAGTALQ